MRIAGTLMVLAVLTMACAPTSGGAVTPTVTSPRGPVSPPPGESPIVNVPTQGIPSTIAPTQTATPTQPPTEVPIAPNTIIATEPAPAGGNACAAGCTTESSGCSIKGNVNSSNERIYHVPGDRDYGRTKIDPENGERWFCTAAEAETNGWRHAQQ